MHDKLFLHYVPNSRQLSLEQAYDGCDKGYEHDFVELRLTAAANACSTVSVFSAGFLQLQCAANRLQQLVVDVHDDV